MNWPLGDGLLLIEGAHSFLLVGRAMEDRYPPRQPKIGETLLEKRFVFVGMGAFLSLLPLAVTSFRWWMKRMGKNWIRLHRLVYLAGALALPDGTLDGLHLSQRGHDYVADHVKDLLVPGAPSDHQPLARQ